jgi:hypothetical protein
MVVAVPTEVLVDVVVGGVVDEQQMYGLFASMGFNPDGIIDISRNL